MDMYCASTPVSYTHLFSPPGYHQYWYSAEKKGYSGTAVFTRMEPISVRYGIGKEEHLSLIHISSRPATGSSRMVMGARLASARTRVTMLIIPLESF